MLDAKRHVCFLDWSADFLEQSTQMRISFKVEHHESCIHEYIGAVFVYRNRVGVSADVIVLLKKCNVVLFVKPMSTTHSRDSGSDDCQFFHSRSACFGKQIMAYNPFFTFIEAPQFGTRHIENAPENPPFHCLIFSIRFFKQGHNCIFVGVHSLEPGFGSFLIMCSAYVPVIGNFEVVVEIKQQSVARHNSAGEKVLAHPIAFVFYFKLISKFLVSEDMYEEFPVWLEF